MFGAAIELAFDTESTYECCNMPFVCADLFTLTWVKMSLYLVPFLSLNTAAVKRLLEACGNI